MNKNILLTFISALFTFLILNSEQSLAQSVPSETQPPHKQTRSGRQRTAANKIMRNHTFSDFGQEYSDFKNNLNNHYGIEYAVDVSYMPQYGAPNGKKAAFQTMVAPSVTWTTSQNEYGTGTLNLAYSLTRYSQQDGEDLANRIGVVTGINDSTSPTDSVNELYYTYQFSGKMNWLTLGIGQFPLYNFDGTTYDSNQQVNFINTALAQNASSTYPTASLGGYIQAAPDNEWTLALGAQDATNLDGTGIVFTHLDDDHYASFASLSYSPTIKGLGAGQYSVMVYNMPYTFKQQQTTNGWSLNASQDIGEKLAVFARINGVSGNQAEIEQSYVLGMVYNNPLNRNPLDQIGFAAAYNKINQTAVGTETIHNAEKILEAYWAWGISKWMTLTPDIQLYFNPALNAKSDHATVMTLRASVFF